MPKIKTHSGAKRRIKRTKSGKLMHRSPNISHFLQKKSASRKRSLSTPSSFKGKTLKSIKRQLGV